VAGYQPRWRVTWRHRLARRCPVHDRPYPSVIRALELDLGLEPSAPPPSLTAAWVNPNLIDCGLTWCRTKENR
jgi:hypothetical protein